MEINGIEFNHQEAEGSDAFKKLLHGSPKKKTLQQGTTMIEFHNVVNVKVTMKNQSILFPVLPAKLPTALSANNGLFESNKKCTFF
jgi:hypothetical protein